VFVHVWLGGDVFGSLVVCEQVVVWFSIAVEGEYISNKFCCCISSRQGNVFTSGGGLDNDALCVGAPVYHCALDPDHQGAGGLPGFQLACKINVCLADDIHGGSFILVVLFMCFVVCV
jgi:hypothetical protein